MKVALVHDYIKEYGGAERVLETLHEMYPDADVYTSVYLPEFLGPHKERFKNWKIKTSWFQHVPFNHKLISPFRLLSAWTFARFDLSDYDVVIVSATGAYFPNMVKTKRQASSVKRQEKNHKPSAISHSPLHICYCHTPPRYLYGYATARDWKKNKVFAFLASIANHFLRIVDFHASKNVDYYVANSEEVAGRIKKFYRRDAKVIYPPVDVVDSAEVQKRISAKVQQKKSTSAPLHSFAFAPYYLTGGRLARAKHVDLILRACSELGVPLKVFGRGFAGYEEELHSLVDSAKVHENESTRAPLRSFASAPVVEFLGEVTDAEKAELMAGAKAFIFASEDEDFGIVPVEAMAHGVPVIAHRSGGVQETVLDPSTSSGQKATGVFFDKLTVESLKEAIKNFERLKIDSKDCRKQAEKFSKERFVKEIKTLVSSVRKM